MSVTVKRNLLVGIGCAVAVALVAGAVLTTGSNSPAERVTAPTERVTTPTAVRVAAVTKALDIVDSQTPAGSAIGVSRRLFDSSPVAVLADAGDPQAQTIAITSASALGVPVLTDDPRAPAELQRLHATTVLTFGHTRAVPGAHPVPVDAARASVEVARLRRTAVPRAVRQIDIIVVTRSRAANASAVANARTAGATVIEIPDADARTSPAIAKTLAARRSTPVIALGRPFADGFAYTLAVVRHDIQQPTGGYLALPGKHYTAMYGHPGAPSLGVLGEQGVRSSVRRVERLARKYRAFSRARFVPTFEIIASVASSGAGKDKNYSSEASIATLRPLVDAAQKAGIYVILDLQPGRADFLTQAKRYRSLLERPHVGLALDPEWRLGKRQLHLRQIGSVTAAEVNRTSRWLAELTRRKALPQKLFILHQFSLSMIKHRSQVVTSHPELATVIHVDGSGPQGAKQDTWRVLHRGAPRGVGWGWKNFVDEDSPMLNARQTWRRVRPLPDLITYQ